tara:strand:+ start:182 stop:367 length:186 start_codon:yes stop_codon:yes gene_type:complete
MEKYENTRVNSLKLASLNLLTAVTISLGLITGLNAAMMPQETERGLNVNEIKLSGFYCGNE